LIELIAELLLDVSLSRLGPQEYAHLADPEST